MAQAAKKGNDIMLEGSWRRTHKALQENQAPVAEGGSQQRKLIQLSQWMGTF